MTQSTSGYGTATVRPADHAAAARPAPPRPTGAGGEPDLAPDSRQDGYAGPSSAGLAEQISHAVHERIHCLDEPGHSRAGQLLLELLTERQRRTAGITAPG